MENHSPVNGRDATGDALGGPDQPEASQPEASQPEASQPEASQPEASQPEASQPEASHSQKEAGSTQDDRVSPREDEPQAGEPSASDAPTEAPAAGETDDEPGDDEPGAAQHVRAAVNYGLEGAAEAIVFAADQPVPAERIAEIYAEVTGQPQPPVEDVERAIGVLNQSYDAEGRAFHIYAWGGGYRMATRDALAPFVKTLFVGEQQQTLSRSLMETLAVLAYKQPATRPEVDFIRGVNSDYAIRKLMEMGLVDVQGRSESLGRPLLYGTTTRFLEQFGLAELDDLPTLREISELLDDPSFDKERTELLQLRAEEQVLKAAEASDASAPEDTEQDTEQQANETPPPHSPLNT